MRRNWPWWIYFVSDGDSIYKCILLCSSWMKFVRSKHHSRHSDTNRFFAKSLYAYKFTHSKLDGERYFGKLVRSTEFEMQSGKCFGHLAPGRHWRFLIKIRGTLIQKGFSDKSLHPHWKLDIEWDCVVSLVAHLKFDFAHLSSWLDMQSWKWSAHLRTFDAREHIIFFKGFLRILVSLASHLLRRTGWYLWFTVVNFNFTGSSRLLSSWAHYIFASVHAKWRRQHK